MKSVKLHFLAIDDKVSDKKNFPFSEIHLAARIKVKGGEYTAPMQARKNIFLIGLVDKIKVMEEENLLPSYVNSDEIFDVKLMGDTLVVRLKETPKTKGWALVYLV